MAPPPMGNEALKALKEASIAKIPTAFGHDLIAAITKEINGVTNWWPEHQYKNALLRHVSEVSELTFTVVAKAIANHLMTGEWQTTFCKKLDDLGGSWIHQKWGQWTDEWESYLSPDWIPVASKKGKRKAVKKAKTPTKKAGSSSVQTAGPSAVEEPQSTAFTGHGGLHSMIGNKDFSFLHSGSSAGPATSGHLTGNTSVQANATVVLDDEEDADDANDADNEDDPNDENHPLAIKHHEQHSGLTSDEEEELSRHLVLTNKEHRAIVREALNGYHNSRADESITFSDDEEWFLNLGHADNLSKVKDVVRKFKEQKAAEPIVLSRKCIPMAPVVCYPAGSEPQNMNAAVHRADGSCVEFNFPRLFPAKITSGPQKTVSTSLADGEFILKDTDAAHQIGSLENLLSVYAGRAITTDELIHIYQRAGARSSRLLINDDVLHACAIKHPAGEDWPTSPMVKKQATENPATGKPKAVPVTATGHTTSTSFTGKAKPVMPVKTVTPTKTKPGTPGPSTKKKSTPVSPSKKSTPVSTATGSPIKTSTFASATVPAGTLGNASADKLAKFMAALDKLSARKLGGSTMKQDANNQKSEENTMAIGIGVWEAGILLGMTGTAEKLFVFESLLQSQHDASCRLKEAIFDEAKHLRTILNDANAEDAAKTGIPAPKDMAGRIRVFEQLAKESAVVDNAVLDCGLAFVRQARFLLQYREEHKDEPLNEEELHAAMIADCPEVELDIDTLTDRINSAMENAVEDMVNTTT